MAFIGRKPTDAPLTSSDVADGIITNAKLAQDIISGDTALASEPADTDEFLVSDAGVLKRIDYSLIKGGGITQADQWRITSNASLDSGDVVSANWERNDNDYDKVGDGNEQWQDWLVDKSLDQEIKLSQKQEFEERKNLMEDAMKHLNEREKEILHARRLSEETVTLDELSKKYKISRERIRQIETKAFEKLQKSMLLASNSKNLLSSN